jgi:HlyD family secretion protein
MKTTRALAWGLAAVAVVALGAWILQPQPLPVEAAEVKRGPFELTVSDDGRTRVRDRYTISAPLAGRVERITLRPGDRVASGQVVATLSPAAPAFLDARTERELRERLGAAQAQQQRALSEVRRVQAQRDQARADRDRQQRLAGDGFISPTALEQAQLALQVAERALEGARFAEEAARHEIAQAQAALTRYRGAEPATAWKVTSPVIGSVLKVMQESEGVVALGAPLLEVADSRSLEAVVDVLSQDSLAIRPGMPARIELGPAAPALKASVRRVEPAAFTKISALGVEEQRVNVVLDFVDPIDLLATIGDGFRVEAHIITHREEDAVKVPVGALFRDGENGWALFVAEDGRAVRRVVKVAMRNPLEAAVAGGVKPGERVIVYPPDSLRDGSSIEIR